MSSKDIVRILSCQTAEMTELCSIDLPICPDLEERKKIHLKKFIFQNLETAQRKLFKSTCSPGDVKGGLI